jgi:hypothetical protein
MATLFVDEPVAKRVGKRTGEHLFFWGMTVLMALIVFIGFARTYFLASYFHSKPLPSALVHVHGAVFTSWMLLLVIQASLAASGNIAIHRRLGLIGLALAPMLVVLGVLVATGMLKRSINVATFDARGIYAVALGEITGFAVPIFFAFRLRRWPDYHKRLILIGTIAMMTAGFGRWPVHALLHKPFPAMLCTFSLILLVGAYDFSSLRKLHPATIFGGAWVIGIELLSLPLGHSAVWHAFTSRVA